MGFSIGKGLAFGALAGAGDAVSSQAEADLKASHEQMLMQARDELEVKKAQLIAQNAYDIQNAPMNRAGSLISDASNQQVPVVASPVTSLSGSDPTSAYNQDANNPNADGKGLSTTADPTLLARIQALPDSNPDKAGMLSQLSSQQASDQSAAQAAVAGQTRKPSMQEAMQTAMQKAYDRGDMQAVAAIKSLAGDKFMTVADGASVIDPATGKVVFQNTGKDERSFAHDTRIAAMHDATQVAIADRQMAQLNAKEKDSPFIKELKNLYPEGSPEYNEALRQRINHETGINGGAGGRSVVYNGRIVASGNEIAAALNNITNLPVSSNAGFFGSGKPSGDGLLNAAATGLKNEINSDQVKDYNTMWTGISRNLGTLETSGLATTGDLIKSIDKLQFVPGDNGYNALRKLAEVRQITEAALKPKLQDPSVPTQQKQFIDGIISSVEKAVPYTHADLTKFKNAQDKNPELTFSQFASQTMPNAASTTDPYAGWGKVR